MVDQWNPQEGHQKVFALQCEKTDKVFETSNNLMKAIQRSKILMIKHQTKILINPIWEANNGSTTD